MQSALSPTIACAAGVLAVLFTGPAAFAACPLDLAIYGDAESEAGIDFRPTMDSATVTNSFKMVLDKGVVCLLYTSPSPRDGLLSRMPSSA